MKSWINKHLNWYLIIAAVMLPALSTVLVSLLNPDNIAGIGYVFGVVYYLIIMPAFSWFVLNKKGRSRAWILLYPWTFIIIPLALSNKTAPQQTA